MVFLFFVSFQSEAKSPGAFSLAFSSCHSEPLRRRIPRVFFLPRSTQDPKWGARIPVRSKPGRV